MDTTLHIMVWWTVCLAFVEHESAAYAIGTSSPSLIAHRGMPFAVPAHTLAGYATAATLLRRTATLTERADSSQATVRDRLREVDYIEPDLVVSKDGILVCHHSPFLDDSTDVGERPEFASRRTTKAIVGLFVANNTILPSWETRGFFTDDFSAVELATLRVRHYSDRPARPSFLDDLLAIPTLADVVTFAQNYVAVTHASALGIEFELKYPSYFNERVLANTSLRVEQLLLNELEQLSVPVVGSKVNAEAVRVVIQCFEPESLRFLRTKTDLPLLQLIKGFHPMPYRDSRLIYEITLDTLVDVSQYAHALGLDRTAVIPGALDAVGWTNVVPSRGLLVGRGLVVSAIAAGLAVHVYTFSDPAEEDARLLPLVVDSQTGCLKNLSYNYYDCGPLAGAIGLHLVTLETGVDGLFSESLVAGSIARQLFSDIIATVRVNASARNVSTNAEEGSWNNTSVLLLGILTAGSILVGAVLGVLSQQVSLVRSCRS